MKELTNWWWCASLESLERVCDGCAGQIVPVNNSRLSYRSIDRLVLVLNQTFYLRPVKPDLSGSST